MESVTIESLITSLRAKLEGEANASRERIARMRQAIESYGFEAECAVYLDVAHALGLELTEQADPRTAAGSLLAVAEELPEFAVPPDRRADVVRPVAAPSPLASLPPTPAAMHVDAPPTSTPPKVEAPRDTVPSAPPESARYVYLLRMEKPLAIVGGEWNAPEKVEKLRAYGLRAPEWIKGQTPRELESVAERIRNRSYGAVIPLWGTMGHNSYNKLVMAARAASVPCAPSKNAGTRDLFVCLDKIEKELATAAGVVS